MSEFGLMSAGFKVKSFENIRKEMQQDLKEKCGTDINLESHGVMGQLVDVFSNSLAELWQQSAALYHSLDPDSAGGMALDSLASITGTQRLKQESDHKLRIRRMRELKAQGRCTKAALHSNLMVLPGVRSVVINNGINKFECLVLGGKDPEIERVIAENKPLGIQSNFKRPTPVNIALNFLLKSGPGLNKAAVEKSVLGYAQEHYLIGKQVFSSKLYAPVLKHEGAIDIVGLAIVPNRVLDAHEYAVIEEINIDEPRG